MKTCWVVLIEYFDGLTKLESSISQEAYKDLNDAIAFVKSRNPGCKEEWINGFTKVVDLGMLKYVKYTFKQVSIV